MGHDVSPVGNHQLDMSSTEVLARDISERFRANVKYGYQDIICCDSEGNNIESTFEVIIQGTIVHPKAGETITLLDENYQLQQMIAKHGDNIYNLPVFAGSEARREEVEEAKRGMCYWLFDRQNDVDYGTIFEDTFRDSFNSFDMRWGTFCMAFTDNSYFKQFLDDLTEFRKNVLALYRKVGGSSVSYLDDQGETQYLVHGLYNWETTKRELETHFKEATLYIPEFMNERKPISEEKLPEAFFDDFSDLK
jgi:hypothetical protein